MTRKSTNETRKSTNTETFAASGMRIRGADVFVTIAMFVTRLSEPVSVAARDEDPERQAGRARTPGTGCPGIVTFARWRERERVDEQQRQRLEEHPREAELRLRVPDLDVAPDEDREELAVGPQLVRGAAGSGPRSA